MGATTVEDVDALAAVAPAWDELAQRCQRPYAGPAWALAWWEHMRPSDARLRVVVVSDGERLVGIAPFYASGGEVALLGGDFAGNVEPLAELGREADVAGAIADALGSAEARPRAIVLNQQGGDPDWPALLARGWAPEPLMRRGGEDASPFVTVEGLDYDGWLAKMSGSFRREARRRQKRFDEAGASLRFATAATLERDVAELLRLHRERLADRGTLLREDGNAPMLVAAGRELLPSGRFRLLCMDVDGATVGAQLLIAGGGEVCAWNSGFDERYAKHSPIMHLLLNALADAIERGDRRLSLGPGGQDYKYRLADGDDKLSSWVLIPRGRGHLRTRLRKGLRSRAAAVRHRFG